MSPMVPARGHLTTSNNVDPQQPRWRKDDDEQSSSAYIIHKWYYVQNRLLGAKLGTTRKLPGEGVAGLGLRLRPKYIGNQVKGIKAILEFRPRFEGQTHMAITDHRGANGGSYRPSDET